MPPGRIYSRQKKPQPREKCKKPEPERKEYKKPLLKSTKGVPNAKRLIFQVSWKRKKIYLLPHDLNKAEREHIWKQLAIKDRVDRRDKKKVKVLPKNFAQPAIGKERLRLLDREIISKIVAIKNKKLDSPEEHKQRTDVILDFLEKETWKRYPSKEIKGFIRDNYRQTGQLPRYVILEHSLRTKQQAERFCVRTIKGLKRLETELRHADYSKYEKHEKGTAKGDTERSTISSIATIGNFFGGFYQYLFMTKEK